MYFGFDVSKYKKQTSLILECRI